jgi:ABC-type multidrug transport system fused ATPase/permease subunit
MSISFEAARQKLITSYGVDVDKYSSDEMVDELSDNLEGILSFSFTVILPIIITGILSLISTVALWYIYNSPIFCILFFIFSIPIFFLGTGALGLSTATKNLYTGISFILGFATNITYDIRKGKSHQGNKNTKDLTLLVLYGIVFPIVKKIIRNTFLGGILYFIIEKAVNRGSRSITNDNEVQTPGLDDGTSESDTKKRLFKVSDKIKNISKLALKAIITFLKVLGIVFIVIGVILIALLFLVHSYVLQ